MNKYQTGIRTQGLQDRSWPLNPLSYIKTAVVLHFNIILILIIIITRHSIYEHNFICYNSIQYKLGEIFIQRDREISASFFMRAFRRDNAPWYSEFTCESWRYAGERIGAQRSRFQEDRKNTRQMGLGTP